MGSDVSVLSVSYDFEDLAAYYALTHQEQEDVRETFAAKILEHVSQTILDLWVNVGPPASTINGLRSFVDAKLAEASTNTPIQRKDKNITTPEVLASNEQVFYIHYDSKRSCEHFYRLEIDEGTGFTPWTETHTGLGITVAMCARLAIPGTLV